MIGVPSMKSSDEVFLEFVTTKTHLGTKRRTDLGSHRASGIQPHRVKGGVIAGAPVAAQGWARILNGESMKGAHLVNQDPSETHGDDALLFGRAPSGGGTDHGVPS
jgi:hypothetical protein